ncbi:MAG TPA: M1 family aminopeptidase [Gemmataceae bacterium]|nr:M1 family aminopeptidase [Gemmataceae bacterium]
MTTRFAPLLLVAVAAFARGQSAPAEPLRTAGGSPLDVLHLRLDVAVDLPKKSATAVAWLKVAALVPTERFSLDAVGFAVTAVDLGGPDQEKRTPLTHRHDGTKLHVDLPEKWPAETTGWVRVAYTVTKPTQGLYFFGPTAAEPDVPLTVWSQGEPLEGRHWIPCIDHPGERQTTEMRITVPDGFEALSNGRLVSKAANADKTVTFHWSQQDPHPSYLVTMVVGRFAVVTEEWKGKPVQYYVPPGKRADVARSFGRTREMLDFFSKRFGIEYPWEKYAQVVVEQFTWGGMENTSATTLVDSAIQDERSMLDGTPDGLIAHELGHQWWGDLVTARDWAHLWLNEGFASYCEVLWDDHKLGKDEGAYTLYQKIRGAIDGGKDRPVVDRRYKDPLTMFDGRAYPKGAWVLHMLRCRLGEEAFWKCIRTYGTEHRHKSVETSDLRRTCERVTGKNLERFFYDWTERPGAPLLDVKSEYLADTKQLKVTVKQTQPGEAFHFPLPIRVRGKSAKSDDHVIEIAEKEVTTHLPLADAPAGVEIDPDLTVLAEITEHKGKDWWAAQLGTGTSVASRIRAAKYFGKARDAGPLTKALTDEPFWGVAGEVAARLGEVGGDAARDALLAGLKSEQAKVRRPCADALGKFAKDEKVAAALKEIVQRGDKSYGVEAAAVRAYGALKLERPAAVFLPVLARESYTDQIRSAALEGLGKSRDLDALDALTAWTQRGKNRRARATALGAVARLLNETSPTDDQRRRGLDAVTASLADGENPHVRRAATSPATPQNGSSVSAFVSGPARRGRRGRGPRRPARGAQERAGEGPPAVCGRPR